MLDTIRAFATAYWYIIVPIVATLFLMIPVIVYWEKVRYGLMLTRHRAPLFGKIRYWVKHPGKQDSKTHFLTSESELCDSYYHYYSKHAKDGQFFKKAEDYLMKINEDNRKEKGLLLWVLIMSLMVIEASAFGYALAPYALTLATPNTAMASAFGIGLVISVVALFLSEKSGNELYVNHMVNQVMAYGSMRESGAAGDFIRKDLINIDNTYDDNSRPAYQQMLNRIKLTSSNAKPTKSFGMVIGYGVFILILAVAAFWVRAETLNASEAELIANPTSVSMSMAQDEPQDGGFDLGDDMQEVKAASVSKSAQDQIDSMHRASLITFAVLSALFCFIQFTSTVMAYSRGFAGSKSKEAWELTRGFANADEFVAHHKTLARSIAVDAQQALGQLQALLAAEFHVSGNDNKEKEANKHERTFERFIEIKRSEGLVDSTNKVIDGMLNQFLQQTEDLTAKGDHAGAQAAFQKAQKIISSLPPESVSAETIAAAKSFQTVFAALGDAQPVATQTTTIEAVETAQPVPVETPAAVIASAPTAGSFDPHLWGNLLGFEEDDLDYVANKKGVEVALIRRAYKLQKLDAELS
jgi:hypothetical protein